MKQTGCHNKTRHITAEKAASLYVAALFVLHPLVLHNGYFDITETKQFLFVVVTVGFVCLWLLQGCCCGEKQMRIRGEDGAILLWLLFYALACGLSGYFRASWLAPDNRYQGLLSMVLYAFVFLSLSRARISSGALYAGLAAFAAVMALAAVNHWGADPLGVMKRLVPFDRGRYISTVGNINFFGSYVCLMLPVAWMLWCITRDKKQNWALSLCILLGTFGAAASKSEGTVLGLGAAFLLMPLFCKTKPEALQRWPLLSVMTVFFLHLFRLLTLWVDGSGFSALTEVILHPAASGVIAAAGIGMYVRIKDKNTGDLLRFRGRYLRGLLMVFFLLLLVLALINLFFADADLGIISKFLVFDSDWGTDRGKIWLACFERWGALPWWQKIIGGGSGCVARLDRLKPVFSDAVVDAAHSEFLHYLLTHGLLGLGLYLTLNGRILCKAAKTGSPTALAMAMGIVGYLAQSSVNIAQPMTTPLYFALLSALAGELQTNTDSGE